MVDPNSERFTLRFGHPTRRGEQDVFPYADDDRRRFNPQAQSAEIGQTVVLSFDAGFCSPSLTPDSYTKDGLDIVSSCGATICGATQRIKLLQYRQADIFGTLGKTRVL